jgi:ATP-dependent helicase/DNAse subunit B
MISLITAAHGARGRRQSLFERIIRLQPAKDFSSIIFLVPNSFTASLIKREFYHHIRASLNCRAFIPFETITIHQLALEINRRFVKKHTISDRAVTLILDSLIRDGSLGLAVHLADLNKKLWHFLPDRNVEDVMKEACEMIFDEKTASRVEQAFRRIQECRSIMNQEGAADPAETIYNAVPYIGQHLKDRILIIDGFIDPTPLEKEFIAAAISSSSRTIAAASERTPLLPFLNSRFPEATKERLTGSPRTQEPAYYEYPSPEDEVDGLAALVKRALLDGCRPWEITVTFPGFSYYLPMAMRVFKREGIPVNVPAQPLTLNPRAVLIEDILSCLEEDYPRISMLSVLTSPLFPAMPELLRDRAVSLSYRGGIIKGRESWLSIKETLLNLSHEKPDETSVKLYSEFASSLKAVINDMEKIRAKASADGFAEALEEWLQEMGFFDSASLDADPAAEETAKLIRNSLNELALTAGILKSSNPEGHQRSPAAYLRFMLSDASVKSEDPDGINIIPYELAAIAEPRIIFTGGMTEEAFPSRPKIDPLLPEKVKKALGLPDLEYYLERQMRYFDRLLNEPELEPVFSCPAAEGDKIFLPSPCLDWNRAMRPPEPPVKTNRKGGWPAAEDEILWKAVTFTDKKAAYAFSKRLNEIIRKGISVTDIDYFRKCPLRFYVEKMLGVEAEQPPRFEVQSRLWGSIAHRTMELLYKDGDLPVEAIGDRIMQCLQNSLQDFPIWPFWRKVAIDIFLNLINPLKAQELQIRQMGFVPSMTEERLTGQLGQWRLKGKIDRIDSSTGNAAGAVLLLDYKTGSPDNRSLQLPLYAFLWRQRNESQVKAAGFYSLKEGRIHWQPRRGSDMDRFIQDAVSTAEDIMREIQEGRFPPGPARTGECRYCGHGPLCSREQQEDE